uniref:59 kDa protein n=1 Tax=Baoding Fusar tick virus 1 TaxID=2972102 RepID=A0A9E7V1T3_9VIRU|nr:MAG: 59 kDa protein [Baoding Fusar tick virus 1]
MRIRETRFACRAMDNNTNSSAAPQRPAPGSYPVSEQVAGPPSVVSTSVQVKDDVLSIIKDINFAPVSYKGDSCWAIPKSKWAEVESKLEEVLKAGNSTVSVAELAELQRELSMLRLKVNNFNTEKERYEYAEKLLTSSLAHAKEQEKAAKAESEKSLKELATATSALKASLASAKQMKDNYEKALRNAKAEGNSEDVDKLAEDKRRLSSEITKLNNSLQQVNSDKKAISDRLKRFERQSLELTNELNLERSRHAIANPAPGQTFADKARAMGSSTVDLFNIAHSNLSALALKRFKTIMDDPTSDEKNTVFWLKATFDATKHSVYAPYKLIFGGLGDDLKALSVKSRKSFDPFLIAVRDSLLPSGQPLSFDDMSTMLGQIPEDELVLNKEYRQKGYKTLADLNASGYTLSTPIDAITPRDAKGKGKSPSGVSQPPVEKIELRHVDPEPTDSERDVDELDPLNSPSSVSSDSDDPSYWQRIRTWFNTVFDGLNNRVKRALSGDPLRLKRYYRLATGNRLQRFLLVPYSWYLWAFP